MYEPKYEIYIFVKESCSTMLNNLNNFTSLCRTIFARIAHNLERKCCISMWVKTESPDSYTQQSPTIA